MARKQVRNTAKTGKHVSPARGAAMARQAAQAQAVRMAITAPVDLAASKPPQGTATKRQPAGRHFRGDGSCSTIGGFFNSLGYTEPPAGTFDLYRRILSDPTVALAAAANDAPVQFAPWTYEAADGVPDEWVKFAQDQMDFLRWDFVAQARRRRYYGFQAFERVYEIIDGKLRIARLKPLLPDITKPIIDEGGAITGLENNQVRIGADKMVWTVYDSEADDPFGRSILENVRKTWHHMCEATNSFGKYVAKNAGIIPLVTYPASGRGSDENGREDDNFVHAQRLIESLFSARGVAIPNEIDAMFDGVVGDILRGGGDIWQLLSWQIKTLDFKSGAGGEMIEALKHSEALVVRGMLRPERSLLESENGSRADAVAHTDTGLAQSDMLHHENCRYATTLLDELMVANFGTRAKGSIKVMPGALTPDDKEFFRTFAKEALLAPGNADLMLAALDFDKVLDMGDIPKAEEVIDLSTIPMTDPQADPNAKPDANADPAATDAKAAEDQRAAVKGTVDTAVQDLALNGAQVQSMVDLANQLAQGLLPRDAVREMMLAAFPGIPPERVDRIVGSLDKFTPPTPPTPPPAPARPPTGKDPTPPKLSRGAKMWAERMQAMALLSR